MKKRIYYIVYSLMQIILGGYGLINAEKLALEDIKELGEAANLFGEALTVDKYLPVFKLTMIASIIIGIILLVMVLKDKKLKNNGLVIGLLIASCLTVDSGIVAIMAIIALVFVSSDKDKDKEEDTKKVKKKIPDIINLKTKKKEYISGIILVLVYFAQFLFVPLIYSVTKNEMVSVISYEIVIIAVAIWAFIDRYKRDFKFLKRSPGAYIGNAFKYWGIMLLCVLGAGIVQTILGATNESANQELLKTLPWLYLILSAIIFAPIVEEAIFRGVFRRFIKNDIAFIITSAICFGLLHTVGVEKGLYDIITYSLSYAAMGGVMAYSYTKTNNIFTSMMVHAIQNTFGVIMMIITTFM